LAPPCSRLSSRSRFADGDEGFVSLKQAHEAAARALEKKRSAESSSSKPAAKKRK